MSDPIMKVPQVNLMFTRIADAASVRCKIAAKRLPNAAQAARIRAAASRFSTELLEVVSELELTKERTSTSRNGGQLDGRLDVSAAQ